MKELLSHLQIKVQQSVYLKDPESSYLGKKIISVGINMLAQNGLESFTFKKLAQEIDTTESSVYRYFESKQKLLLYLTSWYWTYLEYVLVFSTNSITSPADKLFSSLNIIAYGNKELAIVNNKDTQKLHQIIITEFPKVYLNQAVDNDYHAGFFEGYTRIVDRISQILLEINPSFSHTKTLATTLLEGIQKQLYYAEHLPCLTDKDIKNKNLITFYTQIATATLNSSNNGK